MDNENTHTTEHAMNANKTAAKLTDKMAQALAEIRLRETWHWSEQVEIDGRSAKALERRELVRWYFVEMDWDTMESRGKLELTPDGREVLGALKISGRIPW